MAVKKGFTLIEVIVSMMLICIIISFEAPAAINLSEMRQQVLLDEAAAELLFDLRLYQQKSMSEGRIHHIYFNSKDNSYMVYTYKGLENCVLKRRKLPESIVYDSSNSTYKDSKLSFDSRGKPVPYPCTIALKNNKGKIKKIVVSIATDYIYLKDG